MRTVGSAEKGAFMSRKSKLTGKIISYFTLLCLFSLPVTGVYAADITWYDFGKQYNNYYVQRLSDTEYYLLSMSNIDAPDSQRVGILNGKGEIVVAPDNFDVSASYSGGYDITILRKGGECLLISSDGFVKTDVSIYSELNMFENGYATVKLASNSQTGVLDQTGKLLFTSDKYSRFYHIGEGIFATSGDMGQDFYVSGYLVDTAGELLSETYYDSIEFVSDGMIKISRGGKYGFADISGNEVIPAGYERVSYFNAGVCAVQVNGKWGLIDKTGAEVASPEYDQLYWLCGDLYWASADGEEKYGVLDNTGRLILPIEYDNIYAADYGLGEEGFVAVKGEECFLMDLAGEVVFSGDYSSIRLNPDGTVYVIKNIGGMNVSAILDKSGNNLTGFKEYDVNYLNDRLLVGVKRGEYPPGVVPPHDYGMKVALLDSKGNNLTGFKYGNGGDFSNNFMIICESYYGPSGLLNRYGAEVLPTVYNDILLTGEDYVFVRESDPDTGVPSRIGVFKIPVDFYEQRHTPPVTVYLNGVELYFDAEPAIVNSRTMVPMRKIFETLGAEISWDEKERKITAIKSDVTIELTIGEGEACINGEAVSLDAPAVIRDSRTLVPLRFVAEALDCDVDWDAADRRVIIEEGI